MMRSSSCAGLVGAPGKGTGSCGRSRGLRGDSETLALLDCEGINLLNFEGVLVCKLTRETHLF